MRRPARSVNAAMLRLTLICCGFTSATRQSAFPADEALDEKGWREATALARDWPLGARAVRSPTLRARQTAEALNLAAEEDDAIRDLNYGAWSGRTLREISEGDPDALASWLANPDAAPHGGETIAALFARTSAFMAARAAEGGTLIAVTHAAVIRAAIGIALATPVMSFWRIDVAPLARAVLHADGKSWRLRLLSG
jgi:broad specificity phosphatase PhoE